MEKHTKFDEAVSPVVGVMLMLVVTIIIAAVVAVFASGVATSTEATPQLIIKGTYSQSQGMTISHAAGDAIPLSTYNFMTTPSEGMGVDASKFAWVIDKSIIYDTVSGKNLTEAGSPSAFKSGDLFQIPIDSCIDYKTSGSFNKDPHDPEGVNANARVLWDGVGKSSYFGPYAFCNPSNIGNFFYLDIVDKNGNLVTRAKVTITA